MRIFIMLLLVLVPGAICSAQTVADRVSAMSTPSAAILSNCLASADVALCKSLITPNLIKGEVAEHIASQSLVSHLELTGGWRAVTPRVGRQGIDNILIQNHQNGLPKRLIVTEVKYRGAQLAQTKDGIQLGSRWTNKRLVALGNRYIALSNMQDKIQPMKRPLTLVSRHEMQVDLKNGNSVTFWRRNSKDVWKYDGNRESLGEAARKARSMGRFLVANGEGQIAYKKYLYRCNFRGNTVQITVKDASMLNSRSDLGKLRTIRSFSIRDENSLLRSGTSRATREFASVLKKKLPHLSDSEARHLASGVKREYATLEETVALKTQYSLSKQILVNSLKAGTYGAGAVTLLDTTIRYHQTGKIDFARASKMGILSFSSIGLGTYASQYFTVAMTQNAILHRFAVTSASALGLSPSMASGFWGGISSGAITAPLLGYGGYFMGMWDLETAHYQTAIGIGNTVVASYLAGAILSYVMSSGVMTSASGVALYGAAAQSTFLAGIGMGFGVAGGTIILYTGVGILVVGVTAAVLFSWQWYNAVQEDKRTTMTIDWLKQRYSH